MKIVTIIARNVLGLLFVVFGLNQFLHFMPIPPMQGAGGAFLGAMFETHYLYVVAWCQVAGGALLLSGRYLPLGLTLLGPVIVNILCFHIFMAPAGLPMAIMVAALALLLLWRHREHFAGLIKPIRPSRHGRDSVDSRAQAATTENLHV